MSNKSAGKYLLSAEDIYTIISRSMTTALKDDFKTPEELLKQVEEEYAAQFQPTEPGKRGGD